DGRCDSDRANETHGDATAMDFSVGGRGRGDGAPRVACGLPGGDAHPERVKRTMWKAELRAMTEEERLELLQVLRDLSPSWQQRMGLFVGQLFGAGRGSTSPLREALRLDLQYGKVQVIHATAG